MKVSIITAVFNNQQTVGECLQSVLEQSDPNIEHIVIDGGSTDGTLKEIEKYRENLAYFCSEKDRGIFDAYNKGINKATGDIVGILNSDDLLYTRDSIKDIVQSFESIKADLLYGKGVFV